MQNFSWNGVDKYGNTCHGVLFADSVQDLRAKLLKDGIALFDCKKTKNSIFDVVGNFFNRIQTIEMINFFQNLSMLLESGISLSQSIFLVKQQTKNKDLKKIILEIEQDLASGKSFSISISKHSSIFSPFMIFMIKTGEQTGKLDFILKKLTGFMLLRFNLIKKLRQAAFLPIITLSFSIFIIAMIFLFLVPQFETLFESVGKDLPQSTLIILRMSNFLRSDSILLWLLLFLIIVIAFYYLFNLHVMKKMRDFLFLKIFFLRDIVLNFDLVSFLSILSLCLKSGITLKNSLINAEHIANNFIFKKKVHDLIFHVESGESFTNSLRIVGAAFFPNSLILAVSVGEKAGNLDDMLEKQLIFFTREIESDLKLVTTLIQPFLMIFVGILIALLMLSVYLPIFDMANLF